MLLNRRKENRREDFLKTLSVIDINILPNYIQRLCIAHFLGTSTGRSHYLACKGGDFEKSLAYIATKIWPNTPCIIWTIKNEQDFEKYRKEGVDAIIFEGFIPNEPKTN